MKHSHKFYIICIICIFVLLPCFVIIYNFHKRQNKAITATKGIERTNTFSGTFAVDRDCCSLYYDRDSTEGCPDTTYHYKGRAYGYFGHQYKINDTVKPNKGKQYGRRVLWNDIKWCAAIVDSIDKVRRYDRIKRMFISGKY